MQADILCKEQLDKCEQDPRVKVWYTIDRPTDGWKYSSGFINEEMCGAHLRAPCLVVVSSSSRRPRRSHPQRRPLRLQRELTHSHPLAFAELPLLAICSAQLRPPATR